MDVERSQTLKAHAQDKVLQAERYLDEFHACPISDRLAKQREQEQLAAYMLARSVYSDASKLSKGQGYRVNTNNLRNKTICMGILRDKGYAEQEHRPAVQQFIWQQFGPTTEPIRQVMQINAPKLKAPPKAKKSRKKATESTNP